MDKGALSFTLAEGIAYDLCLTNTGNGVLLSGTAHACLATECSRCLEEALISVQGEVEGYFILNPKDEELSLEDDEFVVVGPDGLVDLAPAIVAAIVFELPQLVLCRDDCAGLCPICGANRNEAPCSCDLVEDLVEEGDSPFLALRDLL
ncbi:MAG: YceD family protein [Coriobacteriales bacterium]|jgi:uncharacterized protein|nr:YceD family protein [Coriobacteriales bacterium]